MLNVICQSTVLLHHTVSEGIGRSLSILVTQSMFTVRFCHCRYHIVNLHLGQGRPFPLEVAFWQAWSVLAGWLTDCKHCACIGIAATYTR